MKKIIAAILCCTLCALCFASLVSAEEYGATSLMPDPDGEMTATGCDVTVNANGSVTVTLTASAASIIMKYQDGTTIYEEKYSEIEAYPLFAYFFSKTDGITAVDIHAKYDRIDKDFATTGGADLYLSGMRANPNYLTAGDAVSDYGAWDIYAYLKAKGANYIPADGLLKFYGVEYTFGGNVGDSVTFYNFGTIDNVDEDFGTVIPEEPVEESSEDDVVISSEPESSAPAASSAVESEKPAEPTSDSGIIALAVVAALAVAGAIVVKKVR